jgi:ferredoxin-NADP reductase
MAENPFLHLRSYQVTEIKWETLDVFTLVLAPVLPAEHLSFKAGQWVYLNLLQPDGSVWARAAFSIASAPEDSETKLELCIKVYGEFTKRASKLHPGDIVALQGPFGVFTLTEGVTPLIFMAAGIGITPHRSIIRSLAQRQPDVDIYLFYSNKTVEDVAYMEEFQSLAKRWLRFHPIFTLTRETPKIWDGEHGRIDAAMLDRHLPTDVSMGEALLCGTPEFMTSARDLLLARRMEPKHVRQEKFG